ncbi:MAG: hypothetical protein OXI37_00635 [Gammaproteobacteria bacterium]|nr:hypothetical protein [Gammaproteobacteria bacterium]
MTQDTAEIKISEGWQAVYGWYLPTYRKFADVDGTIRFPIKGWDNKV